MTPLIKRVFQYHGAEHKVINCYEQNRSARRLRKRRALQAPLRRPGRAWKRIYWTKTTERRSPPGWKTSISRNPSYLFTLVPVFLAELVRPVFSSDAAQIGIESLFKLILLLGYIYFLSMTPLIKRVAQSCLKSAAKADLSEQVNRRTCRQWS